MTASIELEQVTHSTKRIKVAHCIKVAQSGGVERRRLSLARNLDPNRFEQLLICGGASVQLTRQFEEAGCRVLTIGPMRRKIDLGRIRSVATLFRQFAPHIVHGAVFEGVAMASLSGRLARVPIIIGEETSHPTTRRWRGHLYYRALTMLTDRMIAVSPVVADYLTRTIRVPSTKVRLIMNGVHEPAPASAEDIKRVRGQLSLSPENLVIGVVGRLKGPEGHPPDSNKRVSDAIDALAIIIREIPSIRLLVVGDGPDRRWLEQRAIQRGVGNAALFTGYQAQTRPFYEIMDVLAHPSSSEATPLVLIEAMFAQLPVVATNVGGIPYVVEDGRTAFLIPPANPQLLANRLLQLLRDPSLRARMGVAGQQRARLRFSEERYVREVGQFYDDLVARELPGWSG